MGSHDDEHGAEHGAQHIEVGFGSRRRVEVISGVERRRRWSGEEKARITAESFVAGAHVSDVARRHAMSPGLLHHWRRLARQAGSSGDAMFVPVLRQEDTRSWADAITGFAPWPMRFITDARGVAIEPNRPTHCHGGRPMDWWLREQARRQREEQ
jgi:transposase-like protein